MSVKHIEDETINSLIESINAKAGSEQFEQGFNQLLELSENQPAILYPEWDYLASFLQNENQYRRYIAIFLLANLSKVDDKNKLETIFDQYFDILYGKRLIAAAALAKIAWKIVEHKPHLEPKITSKLLNIDSSRQSIKMF